MQKYKEKLRIQQLYQENHIIYRIQSKKTWDNGTKGHWDKWGLHYLV